MIPLHDDNPTAIRPVVTVTLIVLCSVVFLWEVSAGAEGMQRIVFSLGLIPAALWGHGALAPERVWVPPEFTVFTSMFLHGGWMHLIGNMLYLWIFGNNVEDAMGHARYIAFYMMCGVAAAFAQALIYAQSAVPMVGASGAISGVLGAYLLLYPHARVMVLIPLGFFSQLMYLPAAWVLGFWFVLQLLSSWAAGSGSGGGVAFFAHIGGFVAGMALIPLFRYKHVRLFHPKRALRRRR